MTIFYFFSATIAYKQNEINMRMLSEAERERKRRLEIEEALKAADERKRLRNKNCEKQTLESISIISSIYENY